MEAGRRKMNETKRIERIRKSLKVAKGERNLKNLEEDGRSRRLSKKCKNVGWTNLIEPYGPERLRELEESRRSLDNKTEQKIEARGWEKDARNKNKLAPHRGKYRGTEANIYSIECRTGREAGDCSGLEERRSHKAEVAIGRKSNSCHICWEAFGTLRIRKTFQISRRWKGLAVRRARRPKREGMVIERIEGLAKDLRMAHKKGQN
jgi:hypothetical protein